MIRIDNPYISCFDEVDGKRPF